MKRKSFILILFLLYQFSPVFGQIHLPEFGSYSPIGGLISHGSSGDVFRSQSNGTAVEPVSGGGWYYAETWTDNSYMGMDPLLFCYSALMRFDSSGNKLWANWVSQSSSSEIVTLSNGSLVWFGDFRSEEHTSELQSQ